MSFLDVLAKKKNFRRFQRVECLWW